MLTPILVESPTGRCGTTLMMQLLGSSPRVAFDRSYPFETRYLSYLAHWALAARAEKPPALGWDATSLLSPPSGMVGPFPHIHAAYWDGDSMGRGVLRAAWDLFSQAVRARGDGSADCYAEKAPPWLSGCLDGVIEHRLVLLVRDPRDVFVSQEAFDRRRGYRGFMRVVGESDRDFEARFITVMRARLARVLERRAAPHAMLVRYEELARDLAGTAVRLSGHVGVHLSPEPVVSAVEAFRHHMTSGSVEQSIGRWKRDLPSSLGRALSRELREELEAFGYEA